MSIVTTATSASGKIIVLAKAVDPIHHGIYERVTYYVTFGGVRVFETSYVKDLGRACVPTSIHNAAKVMRTISSANADKDDKARKAADLAVKYRMRL